MTTASYVSIKSGALIFSITGKVYFRRLKVLLLSFNAWLQKLLQTPPLDSFSLPEFTLSNQGYDERKSIVSALKLQVWGLKRES